MDQAVANATKERDHLTDELSRLEARTIAVRDEIAHIERFLAEWRRWYAGVAEGDASYEKDASTHPASPPDQNRKLRPKNPKREVVGDAVESILRELHRPLNRDHLSNELERRGIKLEGSDPKVVLSTMMWRMQNRFQRIAGKGYWFTGEPLPSSENTGDEQRSYTAEQPPS